MLALILSGASFAAAIVVSPDASTVFVTGTTARPVTGFDFSTVAYVAGIGTQSLRWSWRLIRPPSVASFIFSGLFGGEFPGTSVTADLEAGTASGEGTDTLIRIESLTGSEHADTFAGDVGPNRLFGREGDDNLSGRDGDDLLNGGPGSDTGDGGNHKLGDACVSLEIPTNCEA